MKYIKIIVMFLVLTLIYGCSNVYTSGGVISFEIDSKPINVDPQLASNNVELIIVRNTFEGLVRIDLNGNISPAVAESYTISDDLLTYTFNLSKDRKWSNEKQLTSHDFVFGLRRAVDPILKSPNAGLLLSILNASEIIDGKLSPKDLGVTALDNYTLQIKLKEANKDFLSTLSHAVYMPCNQEFFYSTGGKYGLSSESIISNGSFEIKLWPDSGNIRLTKNEFYNGSFEAKPAAVQFLTDSDQATLTKRLLAGEVDSAIIDSSQYSDSENVDLDIQKIYDTCVVLLINTESNIASEEMQKALVTAIHRNLYANEISSFALRADSFLPPVLAEYNKSLNTSKFDYPVEYDPVKAREFFLEAIPKMPGKKFPPTTLHYIDNPCVKTVATSIVQRWQQDLGAFINIEPKNNNTLIKHIRNYEYQLAMMPIKATDGSVVNYLKNFLSDSPNNITKYNNAEFDKVVNKLNTIFDENKLAEEIKHAEELLISSTAIIPIMYTPSIFISSNKIVDAKYDINSGNIDFSFIEKQENIK